MDASLPSPLDNQSVQPGDEVNLNSLGGTAQQASSAMADGSEAPDNFTGTPGGYSSTLTSWASSMRSTQGNLDSNPLASSAARMALGQRLSDPSTTGVTA